MNRINRVIALILAFVLLLCATVGCRASREPNVPGRETATAAETTTKAPASTPSFAESTIRETSATTADASTDKEQCVSTISKTTSSIESSFSTKKAPSKTTNKNTTASTKKVTSATKKTTEKTTSSTASKYKTIMLNKKTTYFGFTGYFTKKSNPNDVDRSILGLHSDYIYVGAIVTEYYDVDDDENVYFAVDTMSVDFIDLMGYVDGGKGRFMVPVKTKE